MNKNRETYSEKDKGTTFPKKKRKKQKDYKAGNNRR
jgi:hypothetical protein